MLWLKAFHVVFMVTWFAGLFYLPRLFVYHAQAEDQPSQDRFVVMEKKLFAIMSIGGILTIILGLLLIYRNPALMDAAWLQIKLLAVVILVAYHLYCLPIMRAFKEGRNQRSHKWYRWFNEMPSVILIGVVVLAVVRPS